MFTATKRIDKQRASLCGDTVIPLQYLDTSIIPYLTVKLPDFSIWVTYSKLLTVIKLLGEAV